MSKRIISLLLCTVMLFGVCGIGTGFAAGIETDLFQFVQDNYTLYFGDEVVLVANVANQKGQPDLEYTISSSDPAIVEARDSTVFSNLPSVSAPIFGSIKCVSFGKAVITLSASNGQSKACTVLVLDNNPWSEDGNMIEGRGEAIPSGNDWWAEAIGAYDAWAYVDAHRDDLADVTVGIIDNGFDTEHEELEGKMTPLEGYEPETPADHGTHVAGIIGARNDETGIRGIADFARISYAGLYVGDSLSAIEQMVMNGVRVINNSWGNKAVSVEGIIDKEFPDFYKDYTWSVFQNNTVIQLLLENLFNTVRDYTTVHANLAYANGYLSMVKTIELLLKYPDADFLIVESAMNGLLNSGPGVRADESGYYCAITEDMFNSLDESLRERLAEKGITYQVIDNHILIVGAVENKQMNGQYLMTNFSNYGRNVDICAPGSEIFSTVTERDDTDSKRSSPALDGLIYGEMSGTSMAAPMVSAAAALVWQVNPDLTAAEVKDILVSCNRYGAVGVTGEDAGRTYPMLNVGLAVEEAARRKSSRNETDALEPNPLEATPEVQPPTDSEMHHYQVIENGISSWTEAEQYCESLGGHLATISSEEENSYIYQLMLDSGYTSAYFGLTDSESEGTWRWVTGEPLTYHNWATHEPNSENPNEDYAMFYYKFTDGTWNDGDFGGKTVSGGIAFICEWDDTQYNYPQNDQATIVIDPQPSPDDNILTESGLVASGTCGANGDNLTWKYYDDGTLLIEGKGDMADFNFQEGYPLDTAPWLMIPSRQLKTVVIADGVTSIGNYAFASYYRENLSTVSIPNTVTRIGDFAFSFLTGLKSVTLPSSIESIGEYAFGETGLTDVYYAGSEAEWNTVQKFSQEEISSYGSFSIGIFSTYQPPTIHFQSISVDDNTEPLAEQELLAILESHAGHSMDEYVFVDMDHDGTNEIIGVYKDRSYKLHLWYCSSDGSNCSLIYSRDELDYFSLDVLDAGSETHVALNAGAQMGTNRGFNIVRLDNKNPTLIQNQGGGVYQDGTIRMTDEGDIAETVEDYDGSLYRGILSVHTWKDTFLFFDGNTYKEYGAVQLSEDEFMQFHNAQRIKEAIVSDVIESDTRYLEFSYFLRANGIIHVQCNNHKSNGDIVYLYYTLRYTGAELKPDIGTSNWGQMYPSMSSFEAVYPESIPTKSGGRTDASQEQKNQQADVEMVLVTDGYTNKNAVTEFHIPQINIDSETISQINTDIYNNVYPFVAASEREISNNNNHNVTGSFVTYSWAQRENILSLVITLGQNDDFGGNKYLVYNVETSSGRVLSDKELLASFDLSESIVSKAILRSVENKWHEVWIPAGADLGKWDREALDKTLAAANLARVKLYLNKDGNIWIVSDIYIPVEAGVYSNCIDLGLSLSQQTSTIKSGDSSDEYTSVPSPVILTGEDEITHTANKPGLHDLAGQDGVAKPTYGWLADYETKVVRGTVSGNAYLRWSPSKAGREYNRYVSEGETVTVLAMENEYSLVIASDGRAGWVTTKLLS